MIQKTFQTLKLDEIIPYENNPRINDEAVADVVASIEQCENLDPIEIDENNVILSGHTRLKALYELGYEYTEVVRYTGLTEEQKRKYRILANKTAEKASWDFGKLEIELDGLDFKGFDFGFNVWNEDDEYPDAVKYACLHFHYAKAIPVVSYAYNIYENGEWCGVVVFGPGATINIAKMFDCVQGEVLELERVALNGKQKITSECVAKALKALHNEAPQVKIVVSYADQNQGHFGTIYQATNWIYLGDTSKWAQGHKEDYFVIHGKKYHPKSVHSKGWSQSVKWLRENIDPKAYGVHLKPKFKYIYVFNKRLRKKWLKQAMPYPKKE